MEKKTSTFLIILLCIFVAVAGGGVSYLYLADAHSQETDALESQIDQLETDLAKLKKDAKTTTTTTEATTTPTTTANPITPTSTQTATQNTTISTANWKTYTNSDLKISFKYPSNWQIEESRSVPTSERSFVGSLTQQSEIGYFINFSPTLPESDNQTISKQFETIKSFSGNQDKKILQNQNGVSWTNVSPGSEVCPNQKAAFFATGKYIIGFTFSYNGDDAKTNIDTCVKNRAIYDALVGTINK